MRYQCREIGEGEWRDCSKEFYEYCNKSPEHDTRVLYEEDQESANWGRFFLSMMILVWMITTAALGCFALALAPHAQNPDYEKMVLGMIMVNMLCVTRFIYLSIQRND